MKKEKMSIEPKGYHDVRIKKGTIGEISKIREELEELEDANRQGNSILSLCELSDLYGSIEAFLEKNFKGITMGDVKKMSDRTRIAFKTGYRK